MTGRRYLRCTLCEGRHIVMAWHSPDPRRPLSEPESGMIGGTAQASAANADPDLTATPQLTQPGGDGP